MEYDRNITKTGQQTLGSENPQPLTFEQAFQLILAFRNVRSQTVRNGSDLQKQFPRFQEAAAIVARHVLGENDGFRIPPAQKEDWEYNLGLMYSNDKERTPQSNPVSLHLEKKRQTNKGEESIEINLQIAPGEQTEIPNDVNNFYFISDEYDYKNSSMRIGYIVGSDQPICTDYATNGKPQTGEIAYQHSARILSELAEILIEIYAETEADPSYRVRI